MPIRHSLTIILLLAIATSASAESLVVAVNTLSQLGNSGYIDLQLNPGTLVSDPVQAVFSNFSGATLNPLDPNDGNTGDVTGEFPDSVTIANTDTTNEYFEALTFGNSLTFTVTFSGAGVDPTGNAGGSSGTNFVLDFLDPSGDYLFSTDPSGSTSGADPDWAVSVIAFDNTGVETDYTNPDFGNGAPVVTISATPEPATWEIFGGGLLWVGIIATRKRRQKRQ